MLFSLGLYSNNKIILFYVLVPENAHTAISLVYALVLCETYVFVSTWEKHDGRKKRVYLKGK